MFVIPKARKVTPVKTMIHGAEQTEKMNIRKTDLERGTTLSTVTLKVLGCGTITGNVAIRLLYGVYKLLIFALFTFVFVRFVSNVRWSGSLFDITADISLVAYLLQTIIALFTAMYGEFSGRFELLRKRLLEYEIQSMLQTSEEQIMWKRRVAFFYIVSIGTVVVASLANALPFFGIVANDYTEFVFLDSKVDPFMPLFICLSITLWWMSNVQYVFACLYVSLGWSSFATKLTWTSMEECRTFDSLVDWGLLKYGQLYSLTRHLDSTFGLFILLELAVSIPTAILDLYVMCMPASSVPLKMSFVSRFVGSASQIAVICYTSIINTRLTTVKPKFYDTYVKYVQSAKDSGSNSLSHLVTLQKAETLLSRLETRDVGVSACSLALVDNAFMLTIGSTIFNYFFLLIQFAIDDSKQNIVLNCTDVSL